MLEVTLQNCLVLIDIAWHIHIVVRNPLLVLDIARFFRSKIFLGRLLEYLRKYWTDSNIHRICIILSDIMSVLYIQSYFSSNDRFMTRWYNIKLSTWYLLLLHLIWYFQHDICYMILPTYNFSLKFLTHYLSPSVWMSDTHKMILLSLHYRMLNWYPTLVTW